MEGAVEHGGEEVVEVDGVVGDEDAAGDEAGDDEFVAVGVDVFFGVEEAEGDIGEVGEMGAGVGVDEVDGVIEAGEAEGFLGEGDLGGEDFEGGGRHFLARQARASHMEE